MILNVLLSERCYLKAVIILSFLGNCENKWYKVYENDDNGVGLTGGFKTLVNALNKGAEVRVRFPTNSVVAPLQYVIADYNVVCGQIIFSMLKEDYDRFQVSIIELFLYYGV